MFFSKTKKPKHPLQSLFEEGKRFRLLPSFDTSVWLNQVEINPSINIPVMRRFNERTIREKLIEKCPPLRHHPEIFDMSNGPKCSYVVDAIRPSVDVSVGFPRITFNISTDAVRELLYDYNVIGEEDNSSSPDVFHVSLIFAVMIVEMYGCVIHSANIGKVVNMDRSSQDFKISMLIDERDLPYCCQYLSTYTAEVRYEQMNGITRNVAA